MKRDDLLREGKRHRWRGLRLAVSDCPLPPLRVEIAPHRWLAIMQNDRPVLLGQVDSDHWGVNVLRTGEFSSLLEPLSAAQARNAPPPDTEAWFQHWAHLVATGLGSSTNGPMYDGSWMLEPAHIASATLTLRGPGLSGPDCVASTQVGFDPRLLESEADLYISWGGHDPGEVLPLRVLSHPSAGRVKAYRKLARERILPPVLIWWIGGLATYVIIDGHDRLQAAVVEGVTPPLLTISSTLEQDDPRISSPARSVEAMIEQLRALDQRDENTSPQAAAIGQRLASTQLYLETVSRTRAWPLGGGQARWRDLAQKYDRGWLRRLSD